MKIVVIGGTSQPGSQVVTILKQNAPRTIVAAQDGTADTVSDDCRPQRAGITEDAASRSRGGTGCSGRDCARCSSCAAIDGLAITGPEIRRADEPTARDAEGSPTARYCGIRMADLLLLPDYRAIRDTITFGGWPASLAPPREK